MTESREELHFRSGDGSCAAWLLRPHPLNSMACPVIVMAHGLTATREDGLLPFAERFAEAGIATLAFDYRGFGDSSGGEPQVLNIKRELEDVESALAFARTLEGIDPRRVALWGSSFGAGLALEAASKAHGLACVIAQVPFTDGMSSVRRASPTTAAKLAGRAIADLRAHRAGAPRVMVPAAGVPGAVAVMTSPDALSGFESIVPKGSRHLNTVAAGVLLPALGWRPGLKAASIECPLLVQSAMNDEITPDRSAAMTAARAPLGELRRYACGHFDVYKPPWFGSVVADQVEFLKRNLISSKTTVRQPAAQSTTASGRSTH